MVLALAFTLPYTVNTLYYHATKKGEQIIYNIC